MIMSARKLSTGRTLFWVALGCVALTLVFFLGAFLAGNSLAPRGAVAVLVVGLILSVVASLVALILGIAGTVAFPALRGRYVLVLLLAIVTSPLLWLLFFALLG